ncbi:MAG TPA: hypothetical protein VLE71_03200 [Actinomycetota bacterium]|nr:hypothetical protein [Actinomycetota bacterium]
MGRVIVGLFLVAHGLVHLLYMVPRREDDPSYPFVPEDRWFARALGLGPSAAKAVAGTLAAACAIAFVISAVALLASADLWEPAAVVGAAISLVLMLLFFHRWLLIGIAIDVMILASVLSLHIPASLFED